MERHKSQELKGKSQITGLAVNGTSQITGVKGKVTSHHLPWPGRWAVSGTTNVFLFS